MPTTNSITGHVFFDHGLPASGITVRAYSFGFGGIGAKLGETKTDVNGFYTISYPPSSAVAGLAGC